MVLYKKLQQLYVTMVFNVSLHSCLALMSSTCHYQPDLQRFLIVLQCTAILDFASSFSSVSSHMYRIKARSYRHILPQKQAPLKVQIGSTLLCRSQFHPTLNKMAAALSWLAFQLQTFQFLGSTVLCSQQQIRLFKQKKGSSCLTHTSKMSSQLRNSSQLPNSIPFDSIVFS